ncbi:MAG: ZIP family zinc transporter [Chloroflexi bacterium]|nr:ZIP family zinc transporter [Chloroflexota bacterium]
MPMWLEAGFWGLVAGSALVIGAAVGYLVPVPRQVIAGTMAFGAGVLVSVLAFDLIAEAHERGGLVATGVGFLIGAIAFTIVNIHLSRRGARHRKRSGDKQVSEQEDGGSGLAIAAGALLDGIPEAMVIGLSVLAGPGVSAVAVIGIFVSNIPEGLASAAGMRRAGRSARYVFGLWAAIAAASGGAAILGNVGLGGSPAEVVAATTALAAGAILAMVADTMFPEAFETAHELTGLVAASGFLSAFILSSLGR